MKMTLQDMRDKLKGQAKADQAIFWYCSAWHSGRDSDLYQILREVKYSAFLQNVQKNKFEHIHEHIPLMNGSTLIRLIPEIDFCFAILTELYKERYGHEPIQAPLRRVRLSDVREEDVLTHTNPRTFPCIEAGWPSRVYLWRGDLHVACAEDGEHRYNHMLRADERGFVVGFLR